MISVVIPAFNEERLIGNSLRSIKNQDFKGDYEVIVVDNCSLDNTAQIARDLGAKVVSCNRKGVSFARQAGAKAASGDIIVQADADTLYPRGWLTRIHKHFEAHPKAIAVAGTFIYKDPPWWAGAEYFLRIFFNILSSLITGRPFIISGANFAFLKTALIQIGGYEHDSYSADQYNVSTRLSQVGKIIYDPWSYCATSERSVAKPIWAILRAFGRNLFNFGKNFFQSTGIPVKKRSKKTASVSTGTYIKIAIPLLFIGVLCYGYFIPASPVFGKVYYRSITPHKVIALTFDDGPNEPYTSGVLDVLEKNGVQATFFLVGANVKLYPQVAQRMLRDGDVIGNHSYSHDANHALSFNAYKDIDFAQKTILAVTGVQPHLYRPPHGKKSPWELEAIKREGFVEVLWSISTNELSGKSAEFLADQIVQNAKPGGIILMHDGYGTLHDTGRANKQITVDMLPLIIQRLQAEGYSLVTIPDLLNVPAYDRISE
jgi:peptidoglycan-N-acetylglucosamine deacetylase